MTSTKNNKPISVNLLSQDEFSQGPVGKVLLWALSIGRYIVVFTELIVILSFLSRFKLDRNLTDLNEAIARQKAIIMSYGDLEPNMRNAQAKIEIVRLSLASVPPEDILSMINSVIPPDIRLEQVQLHSNQVQLSAVALSPQGFARFVNNLSNSPLVTEVTLGSVSSQDEGITINFELSAKLISNKDSS